MILRSTLFTSRGGDTIQALETARLLRNYGYAVDIRLTTEKINYNQYSLLHFFNITRPADILCHIKKTKLPFVVSTIAVNYSEYDRLHRTGTAGFALRFFHGDAIEYVKVIARWIAGKDKLMSLRYLVRGQKSSIHEIIDKAAMVLPNSASEHKRLMKSYACKTRCMIIPNGVDTELFRYDPGIEKDSRMVLCVARIEGLKNQLNLIYALNNTKYRVVLIGAAAIHQHRYYKLCLQNAAANISFVDHLSQQQLVPYYQRAKVHVLPSWFETTGLSSLEAAAMGCSVVITEKGDAHEYFGDDALYCDPGSPQSIYDAVERAAALPVNHTLISKINQSFTWRLAGHYTAQGYHETINSACP